jgi:bleomycin hydrolase
MAEMKREVLKHAVSGLGLVVVLSAVAVTRGIAQEGDLSAPLIENMRQDLKMDAQTKAIRNALTGTNIKAIVENREILASHDSKFSHKVKTKGISNQKSSGRCWMFAGFNLIKPVVLRKLDIEEFEFSQTYLQFWDKLEKANNFLEHMIQYRERDLMDREVMYYLGEPCSDGGYWENFVDLVNKYGVIPKDAMAESASSEATAAMNGILNKTLRKDAARLRVLCREQCPPSQLRETKEAMLRETYRILVLNFGEPPKEFTWRYKLKEKKDDSKKPAGTRAKVAKKAPTKQGKDGQSEPYQVEQKWSKLTTYTPKSFYQEIVGLDLSQYVNIADDPMRPKGKRYEIDLTRNLVNGRNTGYLNVSLQQMKEIIVKMLLDNTPVYFSADVGPDQDSAKGIMARKLYDYDSIYGIDLGMTKAERLLYRASASNHSMVLIGVDLRNEKPVKWLVENSWGSDKGNAGLWTMYDDWFDDNVYSIIVHSRYLPQTLRNALDQPAEKLPVWDPMW